MPTSRGQLIILGLGIMLGASVLLPGGPITLAATPPRPERKIEADLKFAGEMARQGLWREAMFRWERVLADRPNDARLLNNIGVAAEALGQFEKAREYFLRALAVSKEKEIAVNYQLFRRAHPPKPSSPEEPAPAATPQLPPNS